MDDKKQTVTPVLSSSVGYVQDVRDQVALLVRFIIMNPGWTSSLWEDNMLSFRKLAAAEEGNRDYMVGTLATKVKDILSRMFTDYGFETNFKAKDVDPAKPDGRYRVVFDIMFHRIGVKGSMIPALVAGTIEVDPENDDISLSFDKAADAHPDEIF